MLCGQLVRCSVQLHGAIAAYESIPNSLISVLFPSFFDMETSPLSSDNVVNRTARRKKWIMLLMMTRLIRNYSFPLILMKHHITLACPFFFIQFCIGLLKAILRLFYLKSAKKVSGVGKLVYLSCFVSSCHIHWLHC